MVNQGETRGRVCGPLFLWNIRVVWQICRWRKKFMYPVKNRSRFLWFSTFLSVTPANVPISMAIPLACGDWIESRKLEKTARSEGCWWTSEIEKSEELLRFWITHWSMKKIHYVRKLWKHWMKKDSIWWRFPFALQQRIFQVFFQKNERKGYPVKRG